MTFKWVVEIEVDEALVADGFDLSGDKAKAMLARAHPFAYGHELSARVLSAPDRADIRRVQGYPPEEPAAASTGGEPR